MHLLNEADTVLASFVVEEEKKQNNELVTNIIQLLVDMDCYPLNTALGIICENNNLESWLLLSNYGLDIHFESGEDFSILYRSLGSGFITEDLLYRGADLEDGGDHILEVALLTYDHSVAALRAILLFDEKALESIHKQPVQLFKTIKETNVEMIALLIDCGYDATIMNEDGRNILHIVCDEEKDEELALTILGLQVATRQLNMRDNNDNLPIKYAVDNKFHRAAMAMVELQPDLIEEVKDREMKHRLKQTEQWERRVKRKREYNTNLK